MHEAKNSNDGHTPENAQKMRLSAELLENIPSGVALLHYENGAVYLDYANDAYFRIHGIPPQSKETVMGQHVLDFVYAPDCISIAQALGNASENGESICSANYRFTDTGGRLHWINAQAKFAYAINAVKYYYASFADIDQQKREDDAALERYLDAQAFAESESSLNLSTSRINISTAMVEMVHGPCTFISTGPLDDVRESIVAHILREDDRRVFENLFTRNRLMAEFSKGTQSLDRDLYICRTDGQPLWAKFTLHFARNPQTGNALAFLTVEDINRPKIMEIIANEVLMDRYECISYIRGKRNSGVNLKLVDVDSSYRMDDYQAEVERYAHANVLEEDQKEFIAFCSVPNVIWTLSTQADCTAIFRIRNGKDVRYKKLAFSYLDSENELLAFTREDVTQQYESELGRKHELEEALKKSEEALAAKSEFLSRMSHDIRTPLNGIMGMTRIAQESTDQPEVLECLQNINDSSEFLLGLLTKILNIDKIDAGQLDLDPQPYDTQYFLDYLTSAIRPACVSKNISLTVQTDPVKDMLPVMDRVGSEQLVFNLLSNAVKFTPEGGQVYCLLKERMVGKDHMSVELTVRDTGIGMSQEFQKHMFEPFEQEDRHISAESSGMGLGLASVKGYVDATGGTIEVQSTLGKGSTFRVHGIFECVPKVSASKPKPTPNPDYVASLSGKHVLVVDDNALNAQIGVAMLQKVGMKAQCVGNGKEAIDAFKASPVGFFDDILMDLRMPVMDGYEATHAIRALHREDAKTVPIIAVTADAYAKDSIDTHKTGLDAYVPKPVDPLVLYRTIIDCVR